jgi:hypothetical protein
MLPYGLSVAQSYKPAGIAHGDVSAPKLRLITPLSLDDARRLASSSEFCG